MTKAKNEITSLRTIGMFLEGRACSDTLFNVLNRAFNDHPLQEEERAAMPFAGGIMQHGYQCGIIWGATLAAGAQVYRTFGPGPPAHIKAIMVAQRLVESFRACYKNINCLEITDLDKSASTRQLIMYFLIKGGSIGCLRMAAKYAPLAFREINIALSEKHIQSPSSPVSCAAMVAKKMGVSDLHTVMAAGFAGGIGLCGGACGALGAAIWIINMNSGTNGDGKIDFNNPKAINAIDRFMKCTDFEFECSEIVGRKFKNIKDHSGYLHDGGCSKIIEALTTV
jgi:hypothetical protein